MDVVIYVKCCRMCMDWSILILVHVILLNRAIIERFVHLLYFLAPYTCMSLQIPELTRERAAGENTDSFHCVGKSGVKIPKNNSLLEGKSHENNLLCLINGLNQTFKFPLLLLNLFLFLCELFLRCLSRILGPGRIIRGRILSILISRLCGVVVPMWCRGLWGYPGIFWGLWVGVMGKRTTGRSRCTVNVIYRKRMISWQIFTC